MTHCDGVTNRGAPCPHLATRGTKCGIHCVSFNSKEMSIVFPYMFKV